MFETSSIDNSEQSTNLFPLASQEWVNCKKNKLLQSLTCVLDPIIEEELTHISQERPDTHKDLEQKESRIKTLERINADKDASILELKEKLSHAQELINAYKQSMKSGDPTPMFKYEYDLTDYSQDTACEHVDILFDTLYELSSIQLNASTNLIENQTSVMIIYMVLHDSQKLKNTVFEYKGTLTNFVDSWNANVVARIEDPVRQKALTAHSPTIKSTLNKAPWKGVSQGSWKSLSYDTSNRNHKIYSKGYNIKSRLEACLLNNRR